MSLFGTAGIRGSAAAEVTPELALAVGRAAALHARGAAPDADAGDRPSTGDPADGSVDDSADEPVDDSANDSADDSADDSTHGSTAAEAPTFVLGRDGRETSPALAAALASGLASGGADVVRLGRVPTPALAFAARGRRGAMVTASHNPPADNGIKLFADGVEYDGAAERAVADLVDGEPDPAAWDAWGELRRGEVLEAYREAVVEYVREQVPGSDALAGWRVAVDCGNGVAALATPAVLRGLGARPVALEANVDGHFPARESKPTPESLTTLRRFVAGSGEGAEPAAIADVESGASDGAEPSASEHADAAAGEGAGAAGDDACGAARVELGIGHDGDGDRVVVVGPDGEVVHEDTVVAALAEHYVRASDADDPVVVTTPNASGRIDDRVAAAGGRTERVALGQLHEGVARERAAGDDGTEVVFAAEPWKHLHTGFGGWIDAVVSAALVAALAADAGGIAELTADVEERPYRKESVPCEEAAKAGAMERLREALPQELDPDAVDTEYGVRCDLDGGWVLVRPSGTEPYVRIYAEHDDVDDLVARVREVVEDAIDEQ